MTFALSDIITSAEDKSPYFDRSRVPYGVLARMASDIQRDLLAKAIRRAPDRFTTSATATIPSPISNAVAITGSPKILQIIRVEVDYVGGEPYPEELQMLPAGRQYDYETARGGYLQDGSLYLTGQAADWTSVDHLTVYYVAQPGDFVLLTDTIVLPDDAKDAFVSRLAAAMAFRVNGLPFDDQDPKNGVINLDVASFDTLATRAELAWMMALTDQVRRARTANRNELGLM